MGRGEIYEKYFPEVVRDIYKLVREEEIELVSIKREYGERLARLISRKDIYQFVNWIAAGGEALLIECKEQTGMQRRVAVKIAWPQFQAPGERSVINTINPLKSKVVQRNTYYLRFRRGVRHQQQINESVSFTNGSIPHIYDVSDQPLYFVMQYISGAGFDRWVLRADLKERAEFFVKILRFIHEIHLHSIFHRDLKPNNIIVRKGKPVLIDLTTAKSLDDDEEVTIFPFGMGCRHYASPEMLYDAGTADHRADIYSLGKIMEYAWTRKTPTSKGDNLPDKLKPIYNKACERVPDRRYQLASSFLRDYRAAMKSIKIEQQEKKLPDMDKLFDGFIYKDIAIALYRAMWEISQTKNQ